MLNIPTTHSNNLSYVQLLPSMYQHDTDNQCAKKNYQKDSQPIVLNISTIKTVNQCVKFIHQQTQSTNVSKI